MLCNITEREGGYEHVQKCALSGVHLTMPYVIFRHLQPSNAVGRDNQGPQVHQRLLTLVRDAPEELTQIKM